MFELKWGNNDWVLVYTGKHSTEDISYLGGKLIETVERVRVALSQDELFSIFKLTMEDTKKLLSILGEIEICSSWNGFHYRGTDEIVRSLKWMLSSHEIYDTNEVEINNWE